MKICKLYIGEHEASSEGSGGGEVEEPENPDEEEPPVVEEEESFADTVTEASHYGDYVEYPIDLNGDGNTANDWRIFYNDGEHIFIIAADYVKNNSSYLNNAGTGMIRDSNYNSIYNLDWSSSVETPVQDTSQAILFGQKLWTDYSSYDNARRISTLLNTSNWTGFVDSTYADCAIGGPTIEMWIASYNAKGYTPLYCNNITDVGYYIGNINKPTGYSYELDEDANTGYGDILYFSHQEIISNCYGYYLASPSAVGTANVMRVDYDGCVGHKSYSSYIGVRPVVCLNSEVTATQDENTKVWKLSI